MKILAESLEIFRITFIKHEEAKYEILLLNKETVLEINWLNAFQDDCIDLFNGEVWSPIEN